MPTWSRRSKARTSTRSSLTAAVRSRSKRLSRHRPQRQAVWSSQTTNDKGRTQWKRHSATPFLMKRLRSEHPFSLLLTQNSAQSNMSFKFRRSTSSTESWSRHADTECGSSIVTRSRTSGRRQFDAPSPTTRLNLFQHRKEHWPYVRTWPETRDSHSPLAGVGFLGVSIGKSSTSHQQQRLVGA